MSTLLALANDPRLDAPLAVAPLPRRSCAQSLALLEARVRDDTIERSAGADELEALLDGSSATNERLAHYMSTRLLLAGLGGLSVDTATARGVDAMEDAPPTSESVPLPATILPSLLARTQAATRAHMAASTSLQPACSGGGTPAVASATEAAHTPLRVDATAIAITALHASRELIAAWEKLTRERDETSSS